MLRLLAEYRFTPQPELTYSHTLKGWGIVRKIGNQHLFLLRIYSINQHPNYHTIFGISKTGSDWASHSTQVVARFRFYSALLLKIVSV
jgi:hypothetical protein